MYLFIFMYLFISLCSKRMPFCGLRINSIMLGNMINRLIDSVRRMFLRCWWPAANWETADE